MIKRLTKILLAMVLTMFLSVGNIAAYADEEVTFAHLTDIHIWGLFEGRDNVAPTQPERLLLDAINQINSNEKVDFTLITGDIVDAPSDELFLHVTSEFNLLKKPWYYTLGNHDCSWPSNWPKGILMDIIKRVSSDNVKSNTYYTFKPKEGFTFIALDGASYCFEEQQLDFLNKTIKANPDDVIIIFLHTPIMPPMDLQTHILWQKDELLKMFKNYSQPIAIFAGHFHATKIIQDGNILHVASPSLRYSQAFRIVNVQNKKDKVIFNFEYKKTKLNEEFYNAARYDGTENDKNTTITINKPGFNSKPAVSDKPVNKSGNTNNTKNVNNTQNDKNPKQYVYGNEKVEL